MDSVETQQTTRQAPETISVIIGTKDRPDDVFRCIDSIMVQSLPPDEIIIIDSSATDKLGARLGPYGEKVPLRYLYRPNANITMARNIGIDSAAGDIVMFLDDDVILDRDYVRQVRAVFEADTEGRVGGVTGEEIRKHRLTWLMRLALPFYQLYARIFMIIRFGNGRFQPSGFPTIIRGGTVHNITPIEYLFGANMSFRKSVIAQFRCDETSPRQEDDDIAYRVSRRYQNMYTPFAKFVHNPNPQGGYGQRSLRIKWELGGWYHHFSKNLPQDFWHRAAFYWAITGLLIEMEIRAILRRDFTALKAILGTVLDIIRNPREVFEERR